MKKLLLLFVFASLSFVACDKNDDSNNSTPPPPPPATSGTIAGTISLPPGAGGDITNTRVAIYQSFDDWNNDRVLKATATSTGGAFSLTNLTPLIYYLDAWKDNNNNTVIDAGDFFGVYGSGTYPTYNLSPIQVVAGQTTTIVATIFPI
ncbi:MAG: hypothetical protein HXY49_04040 [Ignavibacteriaceae bacterium]|jgi:hypothetical protein|nr:hypothetical protein [Ignavibacteriaceae bacterium]